VLTDERRPVKNPTDRTAEAIDAAEAMFADETGATLDLSPAAKVALIAKIAASIMAGAAPMAIDIIIILRYQKVEFRTNWESV